MCLLFLDSPLSRRGVFSYAVGLNNYFIGKSFIGLPAHLIIKNISRWATNKHLSLSWTVDCPGGAHLT